MSEAPYFPELDVAVALIMCGNEILTGYNPSWGSFTLPMTKRREWDDPHADGGRRHEDWVFAANRAAAEWTGTTLVSRAELILDEPEYQQSDRDSKWKRYHFQVFGFRSGEKPALVHERVAQWLTPDQLLDKDRHPISETARHLVRKLQLEGKL